MNPTARAARAVALLAVAALPAGATPLGACSRARDDATLAPPPGFVPPPVRPLEKVPLRAGRLGFGDGFSPLEVGPNGRTWRWMGAHGELRLQNDGRPRKLRLRGWVPLEFLSRPPSIRVAVDGHPLGAFTPTDRTLDQEYAVDAAVLGGAPTVLVTIDTSLTGHAAGDPRDLGLAVERVDWAAPEKQQ